MEVIKFDRVVSVNSEIQGHGVQNILDGEISPNKNWQCEKGTEKAVVILQLERAVVLTSIHIGNAHSAFVEVLVGKAADSSDQFESLIPMSVFMNPHESKTGTNPNRTRFFNKSDFNEATGTKAWDRIKVVCSQPFNRYVPYGLCFLKVHGEKEAKRAEVLPKEESKEDIEIGSFFKKKRTSVGDKQLTVSEQMKEAEKESKHTPISVAKISEKFSEKKDKPGDKEEGREKHREKATSKRKADEEGGKKKEKTPKKRKDEKAGKRQEKPFEKLFEDVVLVISGFQNPLRGDVRKMALEMGAKYSGDWEPHCTHLVCAYENTPKFLQVKGKGKIVRKEWVEKCHKDRRRYPWRRFALDKADLKQPESEEEVDAGKPEVQVAGCSKTGSEGPDTAGSRSSVKPKPDGDDYDIATEDEEEKTFDTTDCPLPFLPDIFSSKTFYVDPNLSSRVDLERYIVAYNGVLVETFNEDVEYYITDKGGVPLELFRKRAPDVVAIKPSWIWEINAKQKCVPTTPHLVK